MGLSRGEITMPTFKNPTELAKAIGSPTGFKQRQFDIVTRTNPMLDDYHTGIRSLDDIKTWEEVLKGDDEKIGQFAWGDYDRKQAEKDLKSGKIIVFSSKPIENGNFVSTSFTQALDYAGGDKNKVNEQVVDLDDIAWINGDEGQVAFK